MEISTVGFFAQKYLSGQSTSADPFARQSAMALKN
jgi:hypothetical protein